MTFLKQLYLSFDQINLQYGNTLNEDFQLTGAYYNDSIHIKIYCDLTDIINGSGTIESDELDALINHQNYNPVDNFFLMPDAGQQSAITDIFQNQE